MALLIAFPEGIDGIGVNGLLDELLMASISTCGDSSAKMSTYIRNLGD